MGEVLTVVVLVFVNSVILIKMLLGDIESYGFCGMIFLIIAGWIYSSSKQTIKTEDIQIKQGILRYACEKITVWELLMGKEREAKTISFPLSSITDTWIYYTEAPDESRNAMLYSITIMENDNKVEYSAKGKDGFKRVNGVFKKIYPCVAIGLKRRLIYYILTASSETKKYHKFSLAIQDGCFRLKLSSNPYEEKRPDRVVEIAWKDISARMEAHESCCIITSPIERSFRYKISLDKKYGIANRFDHYVIWDIINDLHREHVNRLSELSYMR